MAFCAACGHALEDDDNFCEDCGTRVYRGPSGLAPLGAPGPSWEGVKPTIWQSPFANTGPPPEVRPFESLRTRARVATVLIAVAMVAQAVLVVALANELMLAFERLADRAVTRDEAVASLRTIVIGLVIYGSAFTVAGIAFFRWLHLAWVNVERRALDGLAWNASWAVGWWFVPVMNVFRPYEVVRMLWRASADPADPPGSTIWAVRVVPGFVTWWWILWISGTTLGFSGGGESTSAVLASFLVPMGAQVAAGVLAILYVRRITALQQRLVDAQPRQS